MKRIGLIGGMSWESTAVYYRRINERVRSLLGGLHSADIVMRSVDFHDVVAMQTAGDWDGAGATLAEIGRELEKAGADILLICTNTMHRLAGDVQDAVDIPLLHIGDVTAQALAEAGSSRPLLLATRYTMEHEFYRARLRDRHGITAMVPEADDRTAVHDIIFNELCQGVIREDSRRRYVEIVEKGRDAGADAVILGCTEIGLLIGEDDVALPAFDSTLLHADAAVAFALEGDMVEKPAPAPTTGAGRNAAAATAVRHA